MVEPNRYVFDMPKMHVFEWYKIQNIMTKWEMKTTRLTNLFSDTHMSHLLFYLCQYPIVSCVNQSVSYGDGEKWKLTVNGITVHKHKTYRRHFKLNGVRCLIKYVYKIGCSVSISRKWNSSTSLFTSSWYVHLCDIGFVCILWFGAVIDTNSII